MNIAFIAVCLFVIAADASNVSERDKREKALFLALQGEGIWKDHSRTEELERRLQEAKAMRAASCIPVLIKHLTVCPSFRKYPFMRLMTSAQAFPAYDALREMGLPAVQPVLDQLKMTDPNDSKDNQGQRHQILIGCLIYVYGQAGCGKELAKERIRLEIRKVGEKQAGFLVQALDYRWLNE